MELPRKILIGDGVVAELGSLIRDIGNGSSKAAIITGEMVKARAGRECEASLQKELIPHSWHVVSNASMETVENLKKELGTSEALPDYVVGFGGGRSVDIGKMTAFKIGRPFLSVPTSASHDGISSPFVSIRGTDKPHSVKANTPIAVIADTRLMAQAPPRLISGGCGDLVGKITAVKDWELAREEKGEYFGSYAANLAYMSARIILSESKKLAKMDQFGIRTIVEALISAGVASCIAGSSRPCSGSEHLFSHAVEYVAGPDFGLHGERVGLGTIMMAKLHDLDWERISTTLADLGAPTTAREIGLSEQQIVQALTSAQSLRPDRYTILSKTKLDSDRARELARSVKVI
jgi:glycerol-1-phosphate dehydrogenase [NAD(P)+]